MFLSSIALATLLSVAAPNNANGCAGSAAWGGNCSISNTGSSVEIGATRPGGFGGSGGSRGDDGGPESVPAPPPPACTDSLCRGNYSVSVLRPTLTDVASFAPASAPFVDEPDGWASSACR